MASCPQNSLSNTLIYPRNLSETLLQMIPLHLAAFLLMGDITHKYVSMLKGIIKKILNYSKAIWRRDQPTVLLLSIFWI